MTASKKRKNLFFVKNKQIMERVDVSHIVYAHAEGNFCFLHMKNQKTISIKISFRQLHHHLDQEIFIRVHKSYLINLDYLEQVNIKDKTLLIDNTDVPIGRTYYSDLSDRLSLF